MSYVTGNRVCLFLFFFKTARRAYSGGFICFGRVKSLFASTNKMCVFLQKNKNKKNFA